MAIWTILDIDLLRNTFTYRICNFHKRTVSKSAPLGRMAGGTTECNLPMRMAISISRLVAEGHDSLASCFLTSTY